VQAVIEKASIDEVYIDVTAMVDKELQVRNRALGRLHFFCAQASSGSLSYENPVCIQDLLVLPWHLRAISQSRAGSSGLCCSDHDACKLLACLSCMSLLKPCLECRNGHQQMVTEGNRMGDPKKSRDSP